MWELGCGEETRGRRRNSGNLGPTEGQQLSNPFNIIKRLLGPVASLGFNMFCRAQKTCFTSKGHCFTQLHLGFTRASLRTKAVLIHRLNAVITCFTRPRMLFFTSALPRVYGRSVGRLVGLVKIRSTPFSPSTRIP